ncbi:MAG: protein-tyrosine kinase [Lachnospiraceae bacterium]|nr:protein-tyrosine kinase [Lachnospiraceae bacterium]
MSNAINDKNDVIEIDLGEVVGLLLYWWWLIALCGVLTAAVGFGVSKFVITPQYESTTKVYILNANEGGTLTYSDVQLGSQLTKDYAQLITGRYVLEKVIQTCGLEESYGSLSRRVAVQALTDTRIIAITVTDEDPVMAQLLADEIRKEAAEHIKNVMDIQAVNVVETANLAESPASPSVMKWTAMGALVGFFICAMILVIRFLVDDTIKTGDDVEKYLGLSTLAMIPIIERDNGKSKKDKKHRSFREGTQGNSQGSNYRDTQEDVYRGNQGNQYQDGSQNVDMNGADVEDLEEVL